MTATVDDRVVAVYKAETPPNGSVTDVPYKRIGLVGGG